MNPSNSQPDLRFILKDYRRFIAFGFGSGLSPLAPGTAGTLVGFPIYYLLSAFLSPVPLFGVILFALLAGIPICDAAGKAVGEADYNGIVWDEIAAFMLVLYFTQGAWTENILAFVLFRLFDIWKPFPIRYVDNHLKNGFGVMADDVLAALYAILVLVLLRPTLLSG
ncbi:MAG: phosphatidylglycerophosphatase A [Methylococcaceae bacterium]|nr:phosphatidylglycerophosphatase A [Methylococcaceae bacterium]